MSQSKWALLAGLSILSASVLVVAADSTSQPSEKHHARAHHLIKPYSELTDLTDEQKAKIGDIHAQTLEEIHALEKKEHADIEALLDETQKKELKSIEEKNSELRRSSRSTKASEPETKPAEK